MSATCGSSKDANGNETRSEYDQLNRVTRVVDAHRREKRIEYNDPEGSHVNKSRETVLPQGLVTEYGYDELGA